LVIPSSVANFVGKKNNLKPMVLQKKNARQKKFPTRNMLTELFRWYISIGDNGICSNFFPTL